MPVFLIRKIDFCFSKTLILGTIEIFWLTKNYLQMEWWVSVFKSVNKFAQENVDEAENHFLILFRNFLSQKKVGIFLIISLIFSRQAITVSHLVSATATDSTN